MAEQWLSIVEYARTYRVSDMTVRRRIKTGKLHAILKEGKYFIPVHGSERVTTERPTNRESERSDRLSDEQQSRSRSEMTVVRSHPSAQRTYVEPAPIYQQPEPRHTPSVQPRHHHTSPTPPSISSSHDERLGSNNGNHSGDHGIEDSSPIPQSLRRPMPTQDT